MKISIMPSLMGNAIWFVEAQKSSVLTKCPRCPSAASPCQWCLNKFTGEVFLLQMSDIETEQLFDKMNLVAVNDFCEALNVIGIENNVLGGEIFNVKRLRYLESKYKLHIRLYKKHETGRTVAIREPRKEKYEKRINLMLSEDLPESAYGLIENFAVIQNEKLLPKVYVCEQMKSCKFSTKNYEHFERHSKICIRYNTKRITCKQKAYGDNSDVIAEMVDLKIIPDEALNFRNNFIVTFDLETIEQKFDFAAPERGLVTEANLLLLSIAIGSNLEGYLPKCWVRKTSDASEEIRLVKAFLKELDKLWNEKQLLLPAWIELGYEKLDIMTFELKKKRAPWNEYQTIWRYKRALRSFTQLDIFGFNSGKFDLPCIAGPLLAELNNVSTKVSILKKMTSYFTITTDKFIFKDVLRFTAPCSYDQFVTVWGCPGAKSIWPYSYFQSVEEIKAAKNFPPLAAFTSKLRGNAKPDMQIYIAAKTEFYRRKLLPKSDPDKISSMYGFLKFYNKMDVQPLVIALENCFKAYYKYFGVNAITAMSLPSLAQEAMFRNYSPDAPLIYSFAEANREINELFRSRVFGGLVNTYRRHVCTYDRGDIPKAARYADNGDPFTSIISLDFTSMYLTCQKQDMPTSPGIYWRRENRKFRKNIMCSGHSFKAQQWLSYMQVTDPFLENKDGSRTTIETKYFRGEVKIWSSRTRKKTWPVDGYAKTDHGIKIYEFQGERWHSACPHCNPYGCDSKWWTKKEDISRQGYKLDVIWECQFDKLLPKIQHVVTPDLHDILKISSTEQDIIEGIRSGKIFGFILCDISSPEEITEEMSDFPPLINRLKLTDEHLTPFMKKQVKLEYPNLKKFERETLVQCFNAKDHLLLTTLAQFYLEKGLSISNITKFIQYTPRKSLTPFVDHVTKMRIDAETHKVPGKPSMKGNTAKIYGNSGYGKVILL